MFETEEAFCVIFGTPIDRIGNQLSNAARLFLTRGYNFPDSVQGSLLGAYVDKRSGEFFLFRDRFGTRTLYWRGQSDQILFSSEIKFILAKNISIDKETLYNFMSLNYRMVYGRANTFFEGINEIPTACICSFDVNLKPKISRYWNPPNSVSNLPEKNLQERFNELFTKSLTRSLNMAENPIFYLSGGLDAPIVAAMAKKITGERINTVGAIFPGFKNHNEEIYINDLVNDLSSKHIAIDGSKLDYGKLLVDSVTRHDQPLISATYLLFSHMLNNIFSYNYESIFGGGGGDMVTQGCLEYQPYILSDYFYNSTDQFEIEMENWTNKVGPYLRYWPKSKEDMLKLIHQITYRIEDQLFAKHNPDWLNPATSLFSLDLVKQHQNSRSEVMEWNYSTFRQIRLADEFFRQAVPAHFVEEININSFKRLGSYDPFWDIELIEFGFELPLHGIFKNGFTKPLTRNLGKDILPKSILNRPDKTGLGIPIEILAGNKNLITLVEDFLSDQLALDKLGFDKSRAEKVIAGIRKQDPCITEANFWKISALAAWFYAWT
jgi:asparagine synthase (glutamine-hydrolysing)